MRKSTASRVGTQTYLFWDCGALIRSDYIFCYGHYQEFQHGKIDECPGYERGKYAEHGLCLVCEYDPDKRVPRSTGRIRERYEQEYSASWNEGDAEATRF